MSERKTMESAPSVVYTITVGPKEIKTLETLIRVDARAAAAAALATDGVINGLADTLLRALEAIPQPPKESE